jgi:four helix bundle protein
MSSNIAEGYVRQHDKEQIQFLRIAYGSGAELGSQIDIAKSLYPDSSYEVAEQNLTELMKILNVMLHKMAQAQQTHTVYPNPKS